MSLMCKVLGHRWNGCVCTRCGATREEGHLWVEAENRCEHTCSVCGATETVPHDWFYCQCQRCGQQRDEHHQWLKKTECERVCRLCGKERQQHDWRHVDRGVDRCAACGKTHRLSAEEIARRDEEWAASDEYTQTYEDAPDAPPEQD